MCLTTSDKLYLFPKQETYDKQVIDSAFQKIAESRTKTSKIHFVYAGSFYASDAKILKAIILEGMIKYKVSSVMAGSIFFS